MSTPPATSNGQCSNSLIRDHAVRTINKSIVAAIHVAVRGFVWRRANIATVPRTSTVNTMCPLG